MIFDGSSLVARRKAAGLSQEELARIIGVERTSIHRWEKGVRRPQPSHQRKLADALTIRIEDLHLMLESSPSTTKVVPRLELARGPANLIEGQAALDPVSRWETAPTSARKLHVSEPRQEPESDIARLVALREGYQEMYRRVGGVPTLPRIAEVLDDSVQGLLKRAYHNADGKKLYKAVGALEAIAGVCAYDAQQQGRAQRYLFRALDSASMSEDHAFGGYVVAVLANQALHLGHYRRVIHYTGSALHTSRHHLSNALKADLYALTAKAYARMGDIRSCNAYLQLTEDTSAKINHTDEPAEVSYVTPGLAETQIAEALRRSGDTTAALAYAEESVRTAGSTHLRGQVHRYAGLALILAARGEVDRSVSIGQDMLVRLTGMESQRLTDRLGTVLTALEPYRSDATVRDFLDQARYTLIQGDLCAGTFIPNGRCTAISGCIS